MSSNTLPVLSHPRFPQVFTKAIEKEVIRAERMALGLCWYEDEGCDCRQLATVHPLDPELIDFEYCDRHFKVVTRER